MTASCAASRGFGPVFPSVQAIETMNLKRASRTAKSEPAPLKSSGYGCALGVVAASVRPRRARHARGQRQYGDRRGLQRSGAQKEATCKSMCLCVWAYVNNTQMPKVGLCESEG